MNDHGKRNGDEMFKCKKHGFTFKRMCQKCLNEEQQYKRDQDYRSINNDSDLSGMLLQTVIINEVLNNPPIQEEKSSPILFESGESGGGGASRSFDVESESDSNKYNYSSSDSNSSDSYSSSDSSDSGSSSSSSDY